MILQDPGRIPGYSYQKSWKEIRGVQRWAVVTQWVKNLPQYLALNRMI